MSRSQGFSVTYAAAHQFLKLGAEVPFQRIWTPMQRSRDDESRLITIIPVVPSTLVRRIKRSCRNDRYCQRSTRAHRASDTSVTAKDGLGRARTYWASRLVGS